VSSNRNFSEIIGTLPDAREPHINRLPALVGHATALKPILGQLRFGIVGAGSVGLNLSFHASRLHPASMYFVDPGCFKAASLLTHPILSDAVGKPKASTAARFAKDASPGSRVCFFDGPVELLPATAFAGLDFVLLATDNLDAEIEVGQRCLHDGIPLLQASVHGSTLVAEVRFFANTNAQGPCPRCCFNSAELAYASSNTMFSCEGFYDDGAAAKGASQQTESFSFLCAMAAELCMIQVLRHVAKLGKPVHDRVLQYCGYTDEIAVTPLERRTDCPCDHQVWETVTAPRALADCTPRELIGQAALSDRELRSAVFSADDLHFVESGSCPGCDHRQPIGRFVSSLRSVVSCSTCGSPIDADLYYAHRPAPISLLDELLDRPLRTFLATSPESVLVSGDRSLLFRNPTNGENS
jgi:molybdopterin/thiamine biosynthesis adenylyltransferase